LDDNETKLNKVFENTEFTYKSAIDKTVAVNPNLHQMLNAEKREHSRFMKRIGGKEDPDEKMEYLKAKMQGIRVTGTCQRLKKPNRAKT